MPDPDMISEGEFINADYQIKVTDGHVVVDATLCRINQAETDLYPLTNLVTKKQPGAGPFEKRGQQGNHGEPEQPGTFDSMRRVCFSGGKIGTRSDRR